MSIESKSLFINDVHTKLNSVLTADNRDVVLSVISESLREYELEKCDLDTFDVEGKELLDTYISAKRIEGRSEKTLARYGYIINKTMSGIKVPITRVSVFHIRKYLASEKERGLSDRTLEGIREVLSAYFGWLHREGLITSNPISNLGTIKYAKVINPPYSPVDIEKLKEGCSTDRDKAIISFLLSTGCRINEMCGLNRTDVDFQNQECIVLGKGNKERLVYLTDEACESLIKYLETRKDDNEALFINLKKNRIASGGVRWILHNIESKTGIENIHPHRFRRTLATNLLNNGMAIQDVSKLLGHANVNITQTYYYHTDAKVEAEFKKFIT